MILAMSPLVRRLGLALLLASTATGAAGCSSDGRRLRSPYPRGSDCARLVCQHVRDLGVDRSDVLHDSWREGSRSDLAHTWRRNEPCCR